MDKRLSQPWCHPVVLNTGVLAWESSALITRPLLSVVKIYNNHASTLIIYNAGLSMNILCTRDKSLVQRGFFKNNAGNLLPTLRFLGRLYNLHHFVIIFSLIKSQWYAEEQHILQTWQTSNTMKKCAADIASLQKYDCYENITIYNTKKIFKFNYVL